jgi:putative SOS response-associated peptidase YedK
VIADGYYEWKAEGKKKQPCLYEIDGGKPFAFAGLWKQWWGRTKKLPPQEPCTIITTDANFLASQIHNACR